MWTLPVVDMVDPAAPAIMSKACKDCGFFYLENHGISEDMIQEVFAQSKAFFDLDIETKISVESDKNNRGYRPMGSEKINRANQVKGDTKELFELFRDIDPDSEEASKPLRGPNQWPPESLVPGWRTTMTSYIDTMHMMAERVMGLLAAGIGIDPSFFEGRFSAPLSALRLLHYSNEISDPDKGVFGIGEHSDFSMLSFLAITGELPGLQILLHGEWIDVPPRRGAFICNVGDMLQRWTNNHLRSTMHRVVNKLGRERYSIPFFLAPDFDTEVACLPQFCSEDNPPKYPLTTSGKYLSAKLLGLTSEEGEEK